ncbi:unnamed protein product [Taenia asiatica]|uniref:SH2 domain-containing protein n=1 Tax=Taenia asiatica TaxID=60517 RepID=A0A0R3VST9_TAEAS|nr:unnamed protein product [Taenia asiatica]
MIFRVRDPTANNTSICAQSTSQEPTNNRRSPTSEASEGEIESIGTAQVGPVRAIGRKRYENLQPQLSYIETTEDPFEEIVIRAETYFPSLTNIVRDQSSSYIVEQTNHETLPPPTSVQHPIPQSRQRVPSNNSAVRQNPFNTSISKSKRRGEEELDRRIMMYSRANRNPYTYYVHNSHKGSHQPSSPAHQVMHHDSYYAQQPLTNDFQPPCTSESDVDERTTYDYRDFQAARQKFEQHGSLSQTVVPTPRRHFQCLNVRPQYSVIGTVTSSRPSESGLSVDGVGRIRQINAPTTSHSPSFQTPLNRQPSLSQESGAVARRESHNSFSRVCVCSPGSGCGVLPHTPIHRDQGSQREAIKKYLVSEEVGPGGVKSVFSFPDGMEPSDLTLLRAAISANQPKDAFIPEENDDLEEQLNRQLEKTCVDSRSLQPVSNQASQRSQLQTSMPIQHIQSVSHASGANMLRGSGGGDLMHMVLQHHHQQRSNNPKMGDRDTQEAIAKSRSGNHPLDTLMYNGISNDFVGPNSPVQLPTTPGYPICHRHQCQPQLNTATAATTNSSNSWHIPPVNQHQGMQGNYQHHTMYNSLRFDPVSTGSSRSQTQPTHFTIDSQSIMG